MTVAAGKEFLNSMIGNDDKRIWIGLTDMATEGTFIWNSSNLVANLTDWLPSDQNSDYWDCVSTGSYDNLQRRWIRTDCSNSYPAFCQKSKAILKGHFYLSFVLYSLDSRDIYLLIISMVLVMQVST